MIYSADPNSGLDFWILFEAWTPMVPGEVLLVAYFHVNTVWIVVAESWTQTVH